MTTDEKSEVDASDDEIRTVESEAESESEPEPKPKSTNDEADRSRDGGSDDGTRLGVDRERALSYLRWGTLLALGVVVLISGAGLYSSLGAIIDVWVADRYQPIARTGVNLAILCAAIGGVVAVLRRL